MPFFVNLNVVIDFKKHSVLPLAYDIYLPNLEIKQEENKDNLRSADETITIVNFKQKNYPLAELYKKR